MRPTLKAEQYTTVRGLICPRLAEVCTRYAKASEKFAFCGGDAQAPSSHSVYADFLMEALLEVLTPALEERTGVELWPSYSYYRVYKCGEALFPHTDRPACEISATVCLGHDYKGRDFRWPIYVRKTPVTLEPGDALIYLGCEVEHWRPPLNVPEGGWHAQAFLHYVDRNGPNAGHKFDKRASLYLKKKNR